MSIGKNIGEFRKRMGLTQAALGEKLGVSNQAVSKWEAETTMPDIMLLPDIVRILEVTLEELYGLANKTEATKVYDLPWADDGVLRGVVFDGRRLVHTADIKDADRIVFAIEGEAKSVHTEWNLEIAGNVSGGAKAGRDMTVTGSVSGGVSVGRDLSVDHSISGGTSAGRDITAGGSLSGNAAAGRDLCVGKELAGNVEAARGVIATAVRAGTVKGDVTCSRLECENVEGNVTIHAEKETAPDTDEE